MAEEEDALITIVDVTDPDDPSYADIKTRRRALTDAELKTLRPMLEKVGAYKFFSMEFNFADGPAVKQFIDTVELEEYKRSKQRKNVQETMKGMVAGREVVIDSELIERAFGLVDDGEPIIKPKGETSGLHTFYIKPKFIDLCQNYRGVYLKLFKSEYSYFVNLTHQIQTYCCGGSHENQITLTQYRAVDLMVRGKPVNWNRYLLQNFQDKLRKYKSGPCALYFGGTLTALIYKALQVDYNLVNKPLLISPGTPERNAVSDGETPSKQQQQQQNKSKSKSASKALSGSAVTPYQGSLSTGRKEPVRRTEGAITRSQKMLQAQEERATAKNSSSKSSKQASAKRKRAKGGKDGRGKAKTQRKEKETDSEAEPSAMEADETEEEEEETAEEHDEMPSSPQKELFSSPRREALTPATGALVKRFTEAERLGNELVLSVKPSKVRELYAQATDSPANKSAAPVELTGSGELWRKYEQIYMAQHEFQLEHIVSKQKLEQSLSRVEELESLLKEKEGALKDKEEALTDEEQALKDRDETIQDKDRRVSELESSITALEKRLDEVVAARTAAGSEDGNNGNNNGHRNNSNGDMHPFKVRLKTQTKASEQAASQQRDVEADGGEQVGEGCEQGDTAVEEQEQQQQQDKQGQEEQDREQQTEDKQTEDKQKDAQDDRDEQIPDQVAETV